MKRKITELTEKEKIATLDALYTAVASLKGREAMKSFLRDLLTESERIMLGRRILIARMLLRGDSSSEIAEMLGVGLDTVYRVERWLKDEFPGFENAVHGIEKEDARREKKRQQADPFSFAALKRKYPMHFLLFNLADELSAHRKPRPSYKKKGR